jgi:hypothetical protein
MSAQRLKDSTKNAVRAGQPVADSLCPLFVAVRAIDALAPACGVAERPGISLRAARFDW